jgi:hypothetical protein
LLPFVVARPPTPNAFLHVQTVVVDAPKWYLSTSALSVRMA